MYFQPNPTSARRRLKFKCFYGDTDDDDYDDDYDNDDDDYEDDYYDDDDYANLSMSTVQLDGHCFDLHPGSGHLKRA